MPIQAEAVTEFLLPFFLVNIGMQLQLSALANRSAITMAIVITLVACLTKIFGCGLAVFSMGFKKSLQVGVGMMPRGEVGIVVAQIGLSLGTINPMAYGVVLIMAVATTLIAPPLLVPLFKGEAQNDEEKILPRSPLG